MTQHLTDPLTARCPSCRAPEGVPCRTPSGKTATQPHRARGEAAQQRYFDDIATARQRGITLDELHQRRAALRSAGSAAPSGRGRPRGDDADSATQLLLTDEGMASHVP